MQRKGNYTSCTLSNPSPTKFTHIREGVWNPRCLRLRQVRWLALPKRLMLRRTMPSSASTLSNDCLSYCSHVATSGMLRCHFAEDQTPPFHVLVPRQSYGSCTFASHYEVYHQSSQRLESRWISPLHHGTHLRSIVDVHNLGHVFQALLCPLPDVGVPGHHPSD
jgi:hypothetical protein